jgi:hypothetical protein
VHLEVVHDKVDNANDGADGSVTFASGGDGEVVDVELEVSKWPPCGGDLNDGAEQQPQLSGGKPRSSGDATRSDESAGENPCNPDSTPYAISRKRQPEQHDGVTVLKGSLDEILMRNALKCLDKVEQRNGM